MHREHYVEEEVPARQVGGADDQGHRAVAAADEPGRGPDLPDAQDRQPGVEDRGAVADGEVAIGADDDAVRHAEGPVQARPQAGLPSPVPDARQVSATTRSAFRRPAIARRSRSSSAARTEMSFPTVEPSRRSEHLHDGPGVTVGPGPGFLKTTCINGPSAPAVRARRQLHAGSRSAPPRSTTGSRRRAISSSSARRRRSTARASSVRRRRTRGSSSTPARVRRRNNQVTPVASCGGGRRPGRRPTGSRPRAASRRAPTTSPRRPRCRARSGLRSTDGSFVTTTCTKPIDTAGYCDLARCASPATA